MNEENTIQQEFLKRINDVEMDVTVRFGVADLPLRDVAALGGGSMIELNRPVDEPVDLLINGIPFARGEVVVVDGYYSVRVTEVTPAEKNTNTFFVEGIGQFDSTPEDKAEEAEEVVPANTDGELEDAANEDVETAEPEAAQDITAEESEEPVAFDEPAASDKPPAGDEPDTSEDSNASGE